MSTHCELTSQQIKYVKQTNTKTECHSWTQKEDKHLCGAVAKQSSQA